MTETKLTELLQDAANHTPVGPPPLTALRAGAARRRRRRTAVVTAGTVAVVGAVIAGSNMLTSPRQTAPLTSPTPPLMRTVGFGHAAIAVPADWPTNKAACGTPQQDTVLIDDPSAARLCSMRRPDGVDSVQLSSWRPLDFHADEVFEIHGVRAERRRTVCTATHDLVSDSVFCSGSVGMPSLQIWFRAESSTGAEQVDQLLSRIKIVRDRSGVPSYWSPDGAPTGPRIAGYKPVLKAAGLKVRDKPVRSPSYPAGTILGVSPAVGTMLPVGSTVTVTTAR